MPFMPCFVIFRQSNHQDICVEIIHIGADNYEAQAYIAATAPKAYHITSDLLNYLTAHLEEISKPMSSARFAWIFPTEPAQPLLLDSMVVDDRRFPGWRTNLFTSISAESFEIHWDHHLQRIVLSPPANVFHPSFYSFQTTRDLPLGWVASRSYDNHQLEIIGSKLFYHGDVYSRALFARFDVPYKAIPVPNFESDEVKV
jgi:hypothetical protein